MQPLRPGPPVRPSAIQNSLTGGDPSPQLFSLPVVFLLSPSIVPFFYSIYWTQANQFPLSTVPFTLSSGFMIWQLCSPTNHPTVIAAKKVPFVLRLLRHRKEPLEAKHLMALVEKTDMNDFLQLRNLVMFVLAFFGLS